VEGVGQMIPEDSSGSGKRRRDPKRVQGLVWLVVLHIGSLVPRAAVASLLGRRVNRAPIFSKR